jgi:hypothetical protein
MKFMSPTVSILLLYIIWFSFWGLYNFVLLGRNISTEKTPGLISIYYLLFSGLTLLNSRVITPSSLIVFVIIFLIIIILAFITNDKRLGRLSNSIFQVSWFFSIYTIVSGNLLLSISIFTFGHLPLFFVKHLRSIFAKLLILIASFAGAEIFALLLLTFAFPVNFLLMILIHYCFYVLLRPVDSKYHLNIIN